MIGGTNTLALDIVSNSINRLGNHLIVTTKIVDLSNVAQAAAGTKVPGTTNLQYVTRWQMGNTIYFAAMEATTTNNNNLFVEPIFYAGKAGSIDLCSVSACFPHVLTYPEPGLGGTAEQGTIACPSPSSVSNPCTVTISVNIADVGNPAPGTLLEEVGSYAFASAIKSGAIDNASAQSDTVPLEIDGACCYNARP